MTYYAVARGRKPGIYMTWAEARKQIYKYQGAIYKKFESKEEAESFIKEKTISTNDTKTGPIEIPTEGTDTLIVFTDGACIHNGKKNAKGSYSSIWPYHTKLNSAWILSDSAHAATNNRAEFMGLIKSYDIADILDPHKKKELHVYTDSMFMINCATKWLPKWMTNDFMKSNGTSVLNQDLLRIIDDCMKKRKTKFYHVRAHTDKEDWFSVNNDIADKMAKNMLG